MRRKEKEITDPEVLNDVLRQAQVCRLGLVEAGQAYIVPMNFGYAENSLYFHSAKEGKKIELFKQGGQICFEVDVQHRLIPGDKGCKWTMHYQSVIGYGPVTFLETPEEKRRGLGVIMAHYAPEARWLFSDQEVGQVLVFKLSIETISGKASGL